MLFLLSKRDYLFQDLIRCGGSIRKSPLSDSDVRNAEADFVNALKEFDATVAEITMTKGHVSKDDVKPGTQDATGPMNMYENAKHLLTDAIHQMKSSLTQIKEHPELFLRLMQGTSPSTGVVNAVVSLLDLRSGKGGDQRGISNYVNRLTLATANLLHKASKFRLISDADMKLMAAKVLGHKPRHQGVADQIPRLEKKEPLV